MIKKLRIKLIAVSMLSLLAVLVIIVVSINVISYRSITANADQILEMLADNGGKFPARINEPPIPGGLYENGMSREAPFESRYFFVLMSKDGEVLTSDMDRIAAVDEQTAVDYAQQVMQGDKDKGFVENYRFIRHLEGETVRIIFLDAARSMDNFRNFFFASCGVSLLGLVAVFFLIVIFSGKIIKPVSESYEKQKQFITDAGHEIKTPITIIDADAEVLEMEIGENEWIKDIRSQAKRLGSLTADLIYLAKMEENRSELEMIDFPLSDVAAETAQSFMALARTQNKNFEVDIEENVSFKGDEKAIIQLLNILFDNAVKYSSEDGNIAFTLGKQNKTVSLRISNTVDEFPEGELDTLFDRFYRGDKSHNSKTGGYGIGLSIAKAVVTAHKGKISASEENGNTMVITAALPTA